MSDSVRDLLVRGTAASKGVRPQDKEEARFYFRWVLDSLDAVTDEQVKARIGLALLEEDPAKRRELLQDVLAADPAHSEARREMAILDGRLKREEIIDPNQPVLPIEAPGPARSRRYVCTRCGGKLAFDPESAALACAYCGHKVTEYQAIMQGNPVAEEDFAAALPTARAHRWELATARALQCAGCGASFTLPIATLSGECPFCGAAHIIERSSADLLQPDGVLPFTSEARTVTSIIRQWLKQQLRNGDVKQAKVLPPKAIYLPFWSFDLTGQVRWSAACEVKRNGEVYLEKREGSVVVYLNDYIVAGGHTLSHELVRGLGPFETRAAASFTPDLIADWPAEIYQVSMADASLVAREYAYEDARKRIEQVTLAGSAYRDLVVNGGGITIENFKLLLLPAWVTSYRLKGRLYSVAMNGNSGQVSGERPHSGLGRLLSELLNGPQSAG